MGKTPMRKHRRSQANLLKKKKFHLIIFIRPSAIISKFVLGWLSLNESKYILPVKTDRMFIVHFKMDLS